MKDVPANLVVVGVPLLAGAWLADKARAVVRAFGATPDGSSPAAFVRPSAGELLVVLDPAAAKELE